MNIEDFRSYCLSLKGAEESLPFDDEILVFKVGGKIFSLTGISLFASVNLKCDPEKAMELREQYPAVIPGYHMNKKHWNTILMDGSIFDRLLKEWIKDSYELIVSSLPKKIKQELDELD
jgi:predicted DNA-binding protein (MmcQ/YjbR family)